MRTVGSYGPDTRSAIWKVGLQLLVEHGYEGMTLRQLASAVGIQAGSLYNHTPNKQQLLFDIVLNHMEDLLDALEEVLSGWTDPEDALEAFCDFHIRYHMKRRAEVFVISSELRSLEPANRKKIVALRARYESKLIEILKRGQSQRKFQKMDVSVETFGIIAMLTSVCTWYREDGPLSEDEIVSIYTRMVFNGVHSNPGKKLLSPTKRSNSKLAKVT